MKKAFGLLLALLLAVAAPLSAQTSRVVLTPAQNVTTVLQAAATANGNGTVWDAQGYAVAIMLVQCVTCSGGTTVNFEGSPDNSNFIGMLANQVGSSTLQAYATQASGTTQWQVPLVGMRYVRARVANYSAGTITVTAYGSMVPPQLTNTSVSVSNTSFPLNSDANNSLPVPGFSQLVSGSDGTNARDLRTTTSGRLQVDLSQTAGNATAIKVDGSAVTQPVSAASLPLPSGAATSAAQSTSNTSLSSLDTKTPALGQAVMASSSPVVIASNQTAVPVTDNSGSLTVDSAQLPAALAANGGLKVEGVAGGVAVPVSGTFWQTTQPVSGSVTVTQGTGTNLHIVCDSGCSSSAGFGDNGAFTFGTTAINPIGGVFDDVASNTATENSAAVARITSSKALHVNFRNASGTEIGTSSNPIQVTLANTGANATAVKVDGSAVTQPVSLSTLPALTAGTATIGKLAANSGVDIGDVDVASVSGNVTVVQGTGTNLHVVCDSGCSSSAGFADNAAFTFGTTPINPIAGVFDDVASNSATENSAAVARITASKALHINLRNASGTEVGVAAAPIQVSLANTAANATAVKVDGSAVTQPVSGTFWQATQPVSGTVTANAGTNLNTSALALESGGNLATIAGAVRAEDVLSADAHTGIPALAVRKATPANTSGTDGDYEFLQMSAGRLWVDASGKTLTVDGSGVTQPVSGTVSITANSAVNVAQLAGTTTDTNSGNKSAGTLRVVLATDQPQLTNKLLVTPDANSAVNISQMNGVTVTMGNGVSGTGVQRVTLASDSTGQVALATGSATIGALTANQSVNLNQVNGAAVASPDANSYVISPTAATATAAAASSACNILSAASNNATNCKNGAGNLYGYEIFNTSTTVYYLRLYNLAASPTCSSATGFIRTIPIPPAAAAGQVGGAVSNFTVPVNFGTGIGYCITAGSSSTDNTSAATGIFGELRFK